MLLDEEARARGEVWNYIFGFIKTSVVKCAVELELPDIIEKHGSPVSLSELSSAAGCTADALCRIMRLLAYHGIFKKTVPFRTSTYDDDMSLSVHYAQTPLSRMGPFVLLQGTPNGPSGFKGIGSLLDVGGSYGTALGMLVKAFPWVRGICFDLPEVVAKASPLHGIEFVGGSLFESVPKADAVILMFVLHNWSDEECKDILKICKEAVPIDTGKVMIVDVITDEDGDGDEHRLSLDVAMMSVIEYILN